MASVLYLTDTRYGQRGWNHPSARHRCYHYADALDAAGYRSKVVPLERVTSAMLSRFKHVVFHRPEMNKRFLHAFDICRQRSVKVHADFDDLVFCADYAAESPLYLNGGRKLSQVQEQFRSSARAAGMFEHFLVSTRFLKEKLEQHLSPQQVTVLPNSLPRLFRRPGLAPDNPGDKVIGYFPGSRGHEADFQSIHTTLRHLLGKQMRLLIVGRWNNPAIEELPGVVHLPFSDYNQYLKLLTRVEVSVAPLENNVFNKAKSAVKLIESVSVGTPIVASAIPDMQDHNNPLAVMVENEKEWESSIVAALNMAENRDLVNRESERLASCYSVNNRLDTLREHFEWAA